MEVRPHTMDAYVVKEQRQYAPMLPFDGEAVLDIGGNIGAFAVWAIGHGASEVVSVEPEPENFALLMRNTRGMNVLPVKRAVVPKTDGATYVDLYVNGGENKGAHSLHVQRGRESIAVEAMAFGELMRHSPGVVKCDTEGAEYDFPWHQLSPCVHTVAIELHLNKKHWRRIEAPVLIERMADLGFKAVREPKITESNWYTLGVWKR